MGALALCAAGQTPTAEFFEKKIRPVLAERCYACHGSKMKSPMGGVTLDTKAGLRAVAEGGAESRLLRAVRYTDARVQMPPTGKLPDAVIAELERWILAGAPDPRADEGSPAPAGAKALSIEKGRSWWAFQPVTERAAPAVLNQQWPKTKIDFFVLAGLEGNGLQPSPEASKEVLARRVYLDLIGLPPTYREVREFVADTSADAWRNLVDRLLASPRYGERWGRYWLDVARFAEDNPTSEATNPPYPYAWRYRDWVIEAVNRDVPYPEFVRKQLAADLIPGASRSDLRALGYVGAAPIYHKDARLSKEVIETLATDDWDERVDAVSRGILGLTVACARCHDHKFDPILSRDYYGLASVFASTQAVLRPLRSDIDPVVERRFLWVQQRLIHLDYLVKLLTGEPGTKPEEAAAKVVRFKTELQTLKAELQELKDRYPELPAYAAKFGVDPPKEPQPKPAAQRRRQLPEANEPFINAVYEAGLWIDGSDADLTLMDVRPGSPRDLPVFLRGSVSSPGPAAHRSFPTVLAKSDVGLSSGSGRLELADRIFKEAAPLAARVMVNRVWGWHFGKPIVGTPSDFGTQGEKPTHPELLDDLAARWIANGWSMKWLHREILLSAAYRQDSRPNATGESKDPVNRWLWRMNPRRMDIEGFRDALLKAAGRLDLTPGGISGDLDSAAFLRRTVYGRVSRSRLNPLLQLYDFADPNQHAPAREFTTTPLQQLFVMNSAFLQDQAEWLAASVKGLADPRRQIISLYRDVFSRDPNPAEVDLGLSFLSQRPLHEYTQALLATNEVIFWP
jgi:hypothetical protein